MKTTTIKQLLVKLALILVVSNASAQDLVGMRIDVNKGSNYTDKVWLYSVPSCSNSFDNGWDAYKEIGSKLVPQLFALESDGEYQIDVTNNFNNTYLGFIAGKDSVYTLTFTHQNIESGYTKLYLIDLIANKTIDIYTDGATYTFTANNKTAVKRFKIVSNALVATTVPTSVNDTLTTPTTPQNVSVAPYIGGQDAKVIKTKKIKVYATQKMIVVSNECKKSGELSLYNAMSGKLVKEAKFDASGTTVIETAEPFGSYVVYAQTQDEVLSKTVILE